MPYILFNLYNWAQSTSCFTFCLITASKSHSCVIFLKIPYLQLGERCNTLCVLALQFDHSFAQHVMHYRMENRGVGHIVWPLSSIQTKILIVPKFYSSNKDNKNLTVPSCRKIFQKVYRQCSSKESFRTYLLPFVGVFLV